MDTFRSYSPVPYIVAANKQDLEDAWPAEDLKIVLRVDPSVKVVPCVAHDKETVKQVLLELLYSILELMDEEEEASD